MAEQRRVAAPERRRILILAGIDIARREGGRAVTLARVAEECGVTKPIAYRLFESLADLLLQMEREVVAGYMAVMDDALEKARADGASRSDVFRRLARAYLEHGMGEGAVYDVIAAARTAAIVATDAGQIRYEVPDSRRFAAAVWDLPDDELTTRVIMFDGAADAIILALQAGLLELGDAVEHMARLFMHEEGS